MKIVGIFLVILVSITGKIDIDMIRNSYKQAKDSKENAEKFYELTQQSGYTEDVLLAAYHGCALTLKASFAKKIGERISFFKKGKKLIETAIEADATNIELRMIRLSVQSNAPKITKYRHKIKEDKEFILRHIDEVTSSNLKQLMNGFISSSSVFVD